MNITLRELAELVGGELRGDPDALVGDVAPLDQASAADVAYVEQEKRIGGLKTTGAEHMRDTHPDRIIRQAVWGMLPKNKLGKKILKKLKIYAGSEHDHQAQKPQTLTLS